MAEKKTKQRKFRRGDSFYALESNLRFVPRIDAISKYTILGTMSDHEKQIIRSGNFFYSRREALSAKQKINRAIKQILSQ